MKTNMIRKSLSLMLALVLTIGAFATDLFTIPASAATQVATSDVRSKLDQIANGSLTYNSDTVMQVGRKYSGYRSSEQCKGYARVVWMLLYGINVGSTCGNNYQLDSTTSMNTVASKSGISADNVSSLFTNARIGDFVQMQRRSHGGPHSAIVYDLFSTGVTFLEANADGKMSIQLNTYSWDKLAEKNKAMSVYTYAYYSGSSSHESTHSNNSGVALSETARNAIANHLPLVTYGSMSGKSKVYAYSDSSLSQQLSNRYIAYEDQIVIVDISSDGRAVQVTYPTSKGTSTQWFSTAELLNSNFDYNQRFVVAKKKIAVFRFGSDGGSKLTGTINQGEECILLAKHNDPPRDIANALIIYPVDHNVNGIHVTWKMALGPG